MQVNGNFCLFNIGVWCEEREFWMFKGHKGSSRGLASLSPTESHPLKGDTWNPIAFSFSEIRAGKGEGDPEDTGPVVPRLSWATLAVHGNGWLS